MNSSKDFIVDYIEREYSLAEDADLMSLNYVEEGYIDSLGLIQFIAVLEDEFDITFTDEELAGEEIKVIGKLAEMIDAKRRNSEE